MSDLSDFAREIMKPNPVVRQTFVVRLTLEEVVTRESGITHVRKVLGSSVQSVSDMPSKGREEFLKRGGRLDELVDE